MVAGRGRLREVQYRIPASMLQADALQSKADKEREALAPAPVAPDVLRIAAGKNQHNKVSGDLVQRIGNIADSLAVQKQPIKVKNGGKIWLGSEG